MFFKIKDFDFGPLRKPAAFGKVLLLPRSGPDAGQRGRRVWGRNAGLGARGRSGTVSRPRLPPQYLVSASRPPAGLGRARRARGGPGPSRDGGRPAPPLPGHSPRGDPPPAAPAAECNLGAPAAGRERGTSLRAGGGGPGARRVAPRLTGAHPAQGSPFSSSPDVGRPLLPSGGAGRDAGPRREGELWRARRGPVPATRAPPSAAHAGAPTLGAAARTAQDSVQTEETPAPAPRPGTHAGFMAAGSVLAGRARGAPGSIGRAGEGGGPQGRTAGSGTRRLRRGAPGSRQTPPRAQVSSRPAHFKRANQRPPAGKRAGPRRK